MKKKGKKWKLVCNVLARGVLMKDGEFILFGLCNNNNLFLVYVF